MAKGTLSAPLINGAEYGFGNISIQIENVPVIGATAISYSESADVQPIYAQGRQAVAYGYGNYTCEGSISVLGSEIIALQSAARAQGFADGSISQLAPMTITISYIPSEGQGLPVVDTLHDVVLLSDSRGLSQGDASITVEIPILMSHITWGETI